MITSTPITARTFRESTPVHSGMILVGHRERTRWGLFAGERRVHRTASFATKREALEWLARQ